MTHKSLTEPPEWREAFRNGGKAFERLFKIYWPLLVRYNSSFHDWETAEEVANDAFVALYTNRHKIVSEDHARHFLYFVSRRKMLDVKKSCKRFIKEPITEGLEESLPAPPDEIDLEWTLCRVLSIISELPEHQRSAIFERVSNYHKGMKSNVHYINVARARAAIIKKFKQSEQILTK